MVRSFLTLSTFLSVFIGLMACADDGEPVIVPEVPIAQEGCSTTNLLENFFDSDGNDIYIYEDGQLFLNSNGNCQFELQYFDPDFEAQNYTTDSSETFLKDDTALVPIKNAYIENFETAQFVELFASNIADPKLFWTNFTLQGPMAKTVNEYVALSMCILDNSCDFLDNTIALVQDPENNSNQVIEFSGVAPSTDMVTSKCSLTSVLGYFKKDTDLWYEAKYYIKSGMPYSIVDFENAYFEGSPGPRVVIRDNRLEVENKFGAKQRFTADATTEVPMNQWFTVKVHLGFSNTDNGVIELWQDGVELISTTGINLPTSNSLQNVLEVGISATQQETVLLMDDLRISDTPF